MDSTKGVVVLKCQQESNVGCAKYGTTLETVVRGEDMEVVEDG